MENKYKLRGAIPLEHLEHDRILKPLIVLTSTVGFSPKKVHEVLIHRWAEEGLCAANFSVYTTNYGRRRRTWAMRAAAKRGAGDRLAEVRAEKV